ncbi:MAG: 1-acyl-sn-glycerol-3-phosphate acyltransferase [Actinobacteria bacterium]|nr:1-acyl-sn-glycerol-3-phosphate acyltransferase [Actinomycetota bacterium]MBU2687145.1 1-acyl-sn-glycerol-3-phosphate acyltransferase [Actinomycetota bacterium]
MSAGATWQQETAGPELSYRETADALRDRFEWKHGPASSLLVKALSLVLEPLETGTYRGRALAGEPHRSYPAVNTPLTVFFIPEGRWQRLFLAARLRATGPINIIQDPAADVKPSVYAEQGRKLGSLRMESLVNIQRSSREGIVVVPVTRAFHQLHPEAPATTFFTRVYLFTPMHLLRRSASFVRTIHTARLRNCRPVELADWLESNPQKGPFSQATALHNEVIGRIESEFRACAGPPIPQPWQVRKSVLRDPILVEFMREHAAREGISPRKVSKEARAHIREIASKIRVGVFRLAGILLNIGFDRLLTSFDIDREGIRFICECDSRSRLVLVCCHKSYMDPLILTYGICRSGLTPPQQAAGINLNIWPLGWVLRRCGAFYLRRSFVDQPVYREAFNAYARRLLADNYITAFYIEGTRSRDGKMRKPKTGFMKILDEAMQLGACDGITVLPVYLGYDRVPEEGAHVKEMAGGHKIAETWGLFKRLFKSITDTLGRAYIKFGSPMDFRTIVSENGLNGAADLICEMIDGVTVVTARSLASCALLSSGRRSVSLDEYERVVDELLGVCRQVGLPLAPDADPEGIRAAVGWLASEGRVLVDESGAGAEGFQVAGDQRRFLEFNKNILLAHVLGPSLAALAGHGGEPDDEALLFLRQLFAEEFVFGPGFAGRSRLPEGCSGSVALASLLDPFLEGYLVACSAIGSISSEGRVDKDEMVARCFDEGAGMLEEGSVRRAESLSRIIFENALRCFGGMGLTSEVTLEVEGGKKKTMLSRGELFERREGLEARIGSFLNRDRSAATQSPKP